MRLRVFSKHPSHIPFRQANINLPVLACIRLGSTKEGTLNYKITINSIPGIKNSANKLLMKKCFDSGGVQTALWFTTDGKVFYESGSEQKVKQINDLPFPIVAKHIYGSRGTGNYLLKSSNDLTRWMSGRELGKYIFERFYSFSKEYRLHVSHLGCFYSCRKMLKSGTPDDKKWSRHDDNCVWILEENPNFEKPACWDKIVNDCMVALKQLKMDVAAFDIKVNKEGTAYIIIESNSAPSFGEKTLLKYTEHIPQLIKFIINGQN